MSKDDDSHLKGLAIGHYVVGGLLALFACFPLIHMGIGLGIIANIGGMQESMQTDAGEPVPLWFGWLFFLLGLAFFLVGQAVAVATILSGRYLRQRRNYWFSFVLACIACAFMPIGTVLGVLTIVVLSRDSVKALYGR